MNGTDKLHNGDILVIYRTSDGKGHAHYRSVATSICVVEDVQNINNFPDKNSFLKYSSSYSIFSEKELKHFYAYKKLPTSIILLSQLKETGDSLKRKIRLIQV